MTRIFLIGYMGSGKTTLGRAYAKEMGLTFIDLDWYIEERFHTSVQKLFAQRGEEDFRRMEQKMLHEVADFEDVVIACGGGTPCFFDNMEYMKARGFTVFLDASIEVLFRRLKVARSSRPLLAEKNDEELRSFIAQTLEERMPYYEKVHIRINSDCLESRKQIAKAVEQLRMQMEK